MLFVIPWDFFGEAWRMLISFCEPGVRLYLSLGTALSEVSTCCLSKVGRDNRLKLAFGRLRE
jgi:hypothetical protein